MTRKTTTQGQADTAAGNDHTAQLLAVLGRLVTTRGQEAREPGTVYDAAQDRWHCLWCYRAASNGQPFEHAKDCPILQGRELLATIAAMPPAAPDAYTRRLVAAGLNLRRRPAMDMEYLRAVLALVEAARQPESGAGDEGC